MTFDGQPQTAKKKICPVCKNEFPANQSVCPTDRSMLMFAQKDELIGTILNDRYRVISEVGRGGMSIVYKGLHEMMDRVVAIKMLQSQHVTDQLSIKRFQQEAQAASHLQHPHVITVYDCGVVASGQPYIVMDFLEGMSLSDVVKEENHLANQRALPIFIQACDALEHAHQKGVIHRDLKSSNIMLVEVEGRRDFVKVVDFGIAKLTNASGKQQQNLTQTGEIFGSPIYMSPEQCLGQQLDTRSDIYSMGAVLYETLTGVPPLMGDTIYATMKMHVSQMPEPFSAVRPDLRIPDALERIAFRALAKKPEQRYQSMQEMRDALDQCVASQFETGSMPSLISAPPSMGFGFGTTIPPQDASGEELDLTGGLFGNQTQVSTSAIKKEASAPYITGPEPKKTASNKAKTASHRTTGAASSAGSKTAGVEGRKTGVRKPAAADKKKQVAPAWLKKLQDPKVLMIAAAAILVPALGTGLVLYLNSLGNDNPFALQKSIEGVIYYYRSPTKDPDNPQKELPGLLYAKGPKDPKPVKFDLSQINIADYCSQKDMQDLQVGAVWNIRFHKGPNNTMIMEAGGLEEKKHSEVEDARITLNQFLEFLNSKNYTKAYGLTTNAWQQKPTGGDDFLAYFTNQPHFQPDFVTKGVPPYALKVVKAEKAAVDILIDGHYIFDENQIYKAQLINEDQKWKIAAFMDVNSDQWSKTLQD